MFSCFHCGGKNGQPLPDGSGVITLVLLAETGEWYDGCEEGSRELIRRQNAELIPMPCQWCTWGWKQRAGVYICDCETRCLNPECSADPQ